MSALVQVLVGLAAHVAAAGCLPSARGLALALPAAVVGIALVSPLLRGRPLLALAGGQLIVHAMLAVGAACAGHAAGHAAGAAGVPHTAMTVAHVVALVLCRAGLGRVVAGLERAASIVVGLLRWIRPRGCLRLCRPSQGAPPTHSLPRARLPLLALAPGRGPPRGTPLPRPA